MSFSPIRSIILAVWILNSLNLAYSQSIPASQQNRSPQNRNSARNPQAAAPRDRSEPLGGEKETRPSGRLRATSRDRQSSDRPLRTDQLEGQQLPADEERAPVAGPVARRAAGPPVNDLEDSPPLVTPPGFELTPAQQRTIDDMLAYWEQKTSRIKAFRAEFKRWEFDHVHGPKDGNPRTFSLGEVRYSAPDKGMIKVERTFNYDAEKAKKGVKPPLSEKEGEIGEHWVCDGKSVFEFNHAQSQLIETKLPAEMQGNAIADGPLPFMFGAKAATIKSRHWIRELSRSEKEPNYRLELVPFEPNNFSRVIVHLDAKEFMPVMMEVYGLNKVDKMVYQFRGQRVNAVSDSVGEFLDVFVGPKTPRGWEKIVQDAR